jgi:hypothetical protein
MKRVCLLVVLVAIAAGAGVVRSITKRGGSLNELPQVIAGESSEAAEQREEIRKSVVLTPGATVRVAGINGPVNIETADISTAEIYIERIARSHEAMARRKVVVNASPELLEVRGKSGDVGFFARLFGSNPSERVTLKLPRKVALTTEGVNGSVTIGEIDGPVGVHGVNGRVDVAQASGSAEFNGINGNISVALKQLDANAVKINGVNGNIELQLAPGVNVDLEARGMNGNVVSDLPDFKLERARHGNFSAHVGSGGNAISANGINGNIRVSRLPAAVSVVNK